MKVFSRLKIQSAKQVGTLYHLTNIDGLKHILDKNILEALNYAYIVSFTRNKMLNFYTGDKGGTLFKLIVDGDKLSNIYKIQPYQYWSDTGVKLEEFEEAVKGPIKNISKYITGIIFLKDIFLDRYYKVDFKNTDYDPNELFMYGKNEKYTYGDLADILKKCNKNFGLYIQSGSIIKKDDKWFKEMELL